MSYQGSSLLFLQAKHKNASWIFHWKTVQRTCKTSQNARCFKLKSLSFLPGNSFSRGRRCGLTVEYQIWAKCCSANAAVNIRILFEPMSSHFSDPPPAPPPPPLLLSSFQPVCKTGQMTPKPSTHPSLPYCNVRYVDSPQTISMIIVLTALKRTHSTSPSFCPDKLKTALWSRVLTSSQSLAASITWSFSSRVNV